MLAASEYSMIQMEIGGKFIEFILRAFELRNVRRRTFGCRRRRNTDRFEVLRSLHRPWWLADWLGHLMDVIYIIPFVT